MTMSNLSQAHELCTSESISFGKIGEKKKSKILKKNPIPNIEIRSKVIKKRKGNDAVRRVSNQKAVEKS